MAVTACPACGTPVNEDAMACPVCGAWPRMSAGEARAWRVRHVEGAGAGAHEVDWTALRATLAGAPGLSVVEQYAREEYVRLQGQHDSLVDRSGILLGFVAGVVALTGIGTFHGSAERVPLVFGMIAFVVAAVALVLVLRPHPWDYAPKAVDLAGDAAGRSADELRADVVRLTLKTGVTNHANLHGLRCTFNVAIYATAAGAVLVALAVIVYLVS